jgi:simple sugar transport system substrate-binding protein
VIVYAGGQTLGSVPQYMDAIGKKAGEVSNIGFDLSPAVVKAMQDGFVQLTSDQEPYLQGYLPILSAVLARKYGFAPFSVDTGIGLVTKDQVGSVAKYARAGIR